MRRWLFLLLLGLHSAGLRAQSAEVPGAVSYSRSISIPLNGVLLHDKALDAWTWTFGKEPGARTLRIDREQGVVEGVARVNFRSKALTLREETMGVIQYRVHISSRAGECRLTVNELTHTGNRSSPRGGVSFGLILRSDGPAQNVIGVSVNAGKRIYAEMKATADARIAAVLAAFEARLRANAEQ